MHLCTIFVYTVLKHWLRDNEMTSRRQRERERGKNGTIYDVVHVVIAVWSCTTMYSIAHDYSNDVIYGEMRKIVLQI